MNPHSQQRPDNLRIKNIMRIPKDWQLLELLSAMESESAATPKIYDLLPEDLIQRWDQTLAQLEEQLSRADFRTWVTAMESFGLWDGVMVIRVANSMGQVMLESHVKGQLEDGLGFKIRIEV